MHLFHNLFDRTNHQFLSSKIPIYDLHSLFRRSFLWIRWGDCEQHNIFNKSILGRLFFFVVACAHQLRLSSCKRSCLRNKSLKMHYKQSAQNVKRKKFRHIFEALDFPYDFLFLFYLLRKLSAAKTSTLWKIVSTKYFCSALFTYTLNTYSYAD